MCSKYCGIAAEALLRRLIENIEEAVGYVRTVCDGLKQRYLPKSSSSQVVRVFGHLSLIAGVGELEVSGSSKSPSVYGDRSKPIIIVESELDAILIQQEAANLVCSIALGGVSKKPDIELHRLLKRAPLILLSLDFDDPGKKRYSFWMKQYFNLRAWPAPYGKSPGDYFKTLYNNMSDWLKAGLSLWVKN